MNTNRDPLEQYIEQYIEWLLLPIERRLALDYAALKASMGSPISKEEFEETIVNMRKALYGKEDEDES